MVHPVHSYGGFREVRLVPGKASIAFVEFVQEMQAAMAKGALQRHRLQIEGHTPAADEEAHGVELKISFAKK